jgi:O-antigen ligase
MIFTLAFRGIGYLGPASIRLFRFVSYLSTLVAFIAIVDSRSKFKIILSVFFINIFAQTVLAFLQGIEVLGHFWPIYWREMYGFNDAPVATLSPHHKHIGVVMLMGLSLSLGLLQYSRQLWWKLFFGISGILMLIIPLFSGTRTFLLGIVGVLLGLIWMSRGKAIPIVFFLALGFVVIFNYSSISVREKAVEKINEKYEERIVREYEKGGVAELASERTIIYESIFTALNKYPFLLLTGTGFQAGTVFVFGNGAHNNFLQYLLETGLMGLYFFIAFLFVALKNLRNAERFTKYSLERTMARFIWIGLVGLIFTMIVGETLYAQPSMFTLSGQIMVFLGLGIAPYFWQSIKVNGISYYK